MLLSTQPEGSGEGLAEATLLKAQVHLGRWAAWSNTHRETLDKHPNGSMPQFLSEEHKAVFPPLAATRTD